MLEYGHLLRTIQCTNNQIIILAQNFYFIATCFQKMNIIKATLETIIIVDNVMAKVAFEIINVITQTAIQIIIAGAAVQNIIPFIAEKPVGTTHRI